MGECVRAGWTVCYNRIIKYTLVLVPWIEHTYAPTCSKCTRLVTKNTFTEVLELAPRFA